MTSALPFDDFRALLKRLPDGDEAVVAGLETRLASLGAAGETFGAVGEIAAWFTASTVRPTVQRPLVALFAGTHGVVADTGETAAFVEHCAAGGTAVSQVCGAHDLGLKVFDLALDVPTEDFTKAAAFDERGCAATMAFGMEAIAGGFDLVALGGFGTGGDVAAAAVVAALGCEAGSDPRVDAALAFHGAGNLRDPFEVVRGVGGREIAAIMGAILAARTEHVAVLLEGRAAIAAAAALQAGNARALDHCRLASTTGDDAWDAVALRLGLTALQPLDTEQPGLAGALGAVLVQSTVQAVAGTRPLSLATT